MSSSLILKTHLVSVTVSFLIYFLKTFFLPAEKSGSNNKMLAYASLLSEEEIKSVLQFVLPYESNKNGNDFSNF